MRLFVLSLVTAAAAFGAISPILSQPDVEKLEAKVTESPADRESAALLGKNYAYFVLGVNELNQFEQVEALDFDKATSRFAGHARRELLSGSTNAAVVAEGGHVLWSFGYRIHNPALDPGDRFLLIADDAKTVGLKAMDRAIQIDPDQALWRAYRLPTLPLRTRLDGEHKLTLPVAYGTLREDLAMVKGEARASGLSAAAKMAFALGKLGDAKGYADELLEAAGVDAWFSGNCTFDGNLVLGQIALRKGEKAEARARLLAAGKTKGSPQLNSFGPNMALAKELLDAGEKPAVLEYLRLCKKFWKMGQGKLDRWSEQIAAGETPEFAGNLNP